MMKSFSQFIWNHSSGRWHLMYSVYPQHKRRQQGCLLTFCGQVMHINTMFSSHMSPADFFFFKSSEMRVYVMGWPVMEGMAQTHFKLCARICQSSPTTNSFSIMVSRFSRQKKGDRVQIKVTGSWPKYFIYRDFLMAYPSPYGGSLLIPF